MKEKVKKLVGMIVAFGMVVSTMAVSVPTNVEAASTVKNLSYGCGSKTTFRVDMTGNGKNNKVVVTPKFESSDEFYFDKLTISVDDKKALSLDCKDTQVLGIALNYLKIGKNVYLQLIGRTDNDYTTMNRLYKYNNSNKKLTLAKKFDHRYEYDIVAASGSTITVKCWDQPSQLGGISWKFKYNFSNGKFTRKSSTATVKSGLGEVQSKYSKYYKKNQFKVKESSLTFYTNIDCNSVSFEASKNDVLTLKKIKVSGKKMYALFSNGNESGWIYLDEEAYDQEWFYDVRNWLAG